MIMINYQHGIHFFEWGYINEIIDTYLLKHGTDTVFKF